MLFKQLERNSEIDALAAVAAGHYNPNDAELVKVWLQSKADARSSDAAGRAEASDEESLTISRKALSNSQLATRISMFAIFISLIVAAWEIFKWYQQQGIGAL